LWAFWLEEVFVFRQFSVLSDDPLSEKLQLLQVRR
jgi:hypothetical protein